MITHFIGRLNLESRIESASPGAITIDLQGDEDLIDMFEVACWLGPEDGLIDGVASLPGHSSLLPVACGTSA